MSPKKRFYCWIAGIAAAIVVAGIIAAIAFPYRGRAYGMPLPRKILGLAQVMAIMGVAWAILFRSQLQAGRVTIVGLLVLTAMQAALFWFITSFNSFDW